MTQPKPVLGYPSQRAAIIGLYDAHGGDVAAIAAALGKTAKMIGVEISILRRDGKLPPLVKPEPGIWSTDKINKARRLVAKTMEYIAEALQVPPGELLSLMVSGTMPPMGKVQRVAQLVDDMAGGTRPPDAAQLPALAPPAEPRRDEDEAELARLAAEPPTPPTKPPIRWRLKSAKGEYLMRSLKAYTVNRHNAFSGTAAELEAMFKDHPELKELDPERVP